MAGLGRAVGNRAGSCDALARRQPAAALDVLDQEIEGALRMRLDQLDLREEELVRLEMITVLHFIEPVCRTIVAIVIITFTMPLRLGGRHGTCVGAGVVIDRQQRVQCAGHGNQRPLDLAGGGEARELCADV